MATKKKAKRKTPAKRKTKTVVKAPGKKKAKKRTKSKGFLSEIMNRNDAMVGAKAIGSGASAATIATGVDLIPGINNVWQSVIDLGIGFLAASVARAPMLGAGVASIGFYKLAQEVRAGLSEGMAETKYADPIEKLPMFLDESNNQMLADPASLASPAQLAEKIITTYQPGYSTSFGGYYNNR